MTLPCQTFYLAKHYLFLGTIAARYNGCIHETKLLHQRHVPMHAIQIVAEPFQFYVFILALFDGDENFPHKIHIPLHR